MRTLDSYPLLSSHGFTSKAHISRPKWRTSLLILVCLATIVLIINTIFLGWAIATRGTYRGTGILYEASCDKTRRVNMGIHVLINILSSMLLGGSNYCMQCLSAPSRPEVDAAHARGRYLDIGVPSLHNILSLSSGVKKKIGWLILGILSLPLHLCYNSAVFATLSAQSYGAWQLSPQVKTALDNGTMANIAKENLTVLAQITQEAYTSASKQGHLERLETLDCINHYSRPLQSSRGNVFLIPKSGSELRGEIELTKDPITQFPRGESCVSSFGTEWIYSQFDIVEWYGPTCRPRLHNVLLPQLQADPSSWRPFSAPVDYCLSEPMEQQCKLNFSVPLGVIVIVANALKLLVMLWSLVLLRNDPLLTVGDAASSFLQDPDDSTRLMCLSQQKTYRKKPKEFYAHPKSAAAYSSTKPTWWSSVKRGKFIICTVALSLGVFMLLGLLIYGYRSIKGDKTFLSVLKTGLGRVDPRTIMVFATDDRYMLGTTKQTNLLPNVFLANSPQVVISLIYFSYNATITSMLVAREWSSYFTHAKGLRVSAKPLGAQRSTYFLQLPYRYAILLIAFSCLLHWLASQSLFILVVEVYNMHGNHSLTGMCSDWPNGSFDISLPGTGGYADQTAVCGADFITCAYSPLGIFLALIVACVLVIFLVVIGMKKLNPMPVVGSCSMAIAASCHAQPGEIAPWEKALRWGASASPSQDDGVGHCGLSSGPVTKPIEGQLYA